MTTAPATLVDLGDDVIGDCLRSHVVDLDDDVCDVPIQRITPGELLAQHREQILMRIRTMAVV